MEAEQIVRAVAAADPFAEGGQCGFCHRYASDNDPTGHTPECPWRLAREWIETNRQDA